MISNRRRGTSGFDGIEFLEPRRLLSTTVVVNSTLDGSTAPGMVTLRQAVAIADAATSVPTVITFDPHVFAGPTTIDLESSLTLSDTQEFVEIQGPTAPLTLGDDTSGGALVVDPSVLAFVSSLTIKEVGFGGESSNIVNAGTLDLTNVTLSGTQMATRAIYNTGTVRLYSSTIENYGDGNDGIGEGGAIYNAGEVELSDSTITNCDAGAGGAIYQVAGTSVYASLNINDSTLSDDSATVGNGGALCITGGGYDFFSDSTISGSIIVDESGSAQGMAVWLGASNSFIMNNSTIDNSQYDTLNSIETANPAAVYVSPSAKLSLDDTVIADTFTQDRSAPIVPVDVAGLVSSNGYNFIADKGTSTGWLSSDHLGTETNPLSAELGALGSNGGPTQTQVPEAGSPLINAGSNALSVDSITDQRGYNRIAGSSVDIGATEYAAAPYGASTITGTFYNDLDSNGLKSSGEGPLAGFTAYLDLPNAGHYIPGDPTAVSNSAGRYTFNDLAAGTYQIGAITPVGWRQTPPPGPLFLRTVGEQTSSTVTPIGFTQKIWLYGTVFDDSNKNGKLDSNEAGMEGWVVYIDANHNGKLDSGEVSVNTSPTGYWSIMSLNPGTYTVRVVAKNQWTETDPTTDVYSFTVGAGGVRANVLFGEYHT